MPKFSVIVPVYNVEAYIKQCIESVLNQTFPNFELIIVDDCGEDNSIKIAKEYAAKDKRIKIFYHKENKRQGGARNTGLREAKGEYIFCLDSDDWIEPNALAVLYSLFSKHHTKSIWFNARKYFENTKTFDQNPMYNQEEGYRILSPDNMAAYADFTWIKSYTRESIQKYKLCWPENITFEDGEFYFKYFTYNPKTYIIPDCLVNYRYRKDSTVRNADSGNVRMQDIYSILRHLKDFWTKLEVYEQYKVTMLKLIQNRIRMCYGLNYSDDNKKLSYDFLDEMNFPEDFVCLKNQ